MNEQELRDEFEKFIKTDQELVHYMGDPDAQLLFRKGYSLAQETIKAKDAEIERLKNQPKISVSMGNLESLWEENQKQSKEIAEARELNEKLIWAIDEICKTMNEEKINLGMMNHVAQVARNAKEALGE